jgi:uncharacterized membrane protein
MARGLGWFSIGLGIAQVAAPRALCRLMGVKANPNLLRLLGMREIVSGVGILTQRQPAGWLKARVAGDAMDLALLGTAAATTAGNRNRLAVATAAVAGVTALDVISSRQLARRPGANLTAIHVKRSVTINRSPADLYNFWRNFENLPQFMSHLESVQVTGPTRSHWVARGPAGKRVEWDAEIINERTDELIAWKSLEGADVDNSGSVRFEPAPGGRGTIVRVQFQFQPPAGVLGANVARLWGESPEKQVPVELRRFKQLMETGEILKTEGQSAGRARSTSKKYDDMVRV